VLNGYLSLLEDGAFGDVPEAFAATFGTLKARLAEMETLISAMLETSRLEDDRLELVRVRVDLREIADEAVRRCELFAQPGQALRLRCPNRPVLVDCDRVRMTAVVGNLVHNAIKYSVRHTDVLTTLDTGDGAATLNVADEGIGIAPEDLHILFTRFGRVRHDPVTAKVPGTGLGLFLSRELARMHGGDITVVSRPGAGSTFTLTLPLAE
jgi:signal transduction histidine kinase